MNKKAVLVLTVAVWTFLFAPFASLWAYDQKAPTDNVPPTIDHKPIDLAIANGKSLEVTTVLTDNNAIRQGILFYRSVMNIGFVEVQMDGMGGGLYRGIIPAGDISKSDFMLEYYIAAIDTSGNVTLQGFLSEPMTVMVRAMPIPAEGEIVKEEVKEIVPPVKEVVKEVVVVPVPPALIDSPTIEEAVHEEEIVAVPVPEIVPEARVADAPALKGLSTKEEERKSVIAPFYKKGWFWGLMAVVVGGGILASRDKDSPSAPGSLTITGPSL